MTAAGMTRIGSTSAEVQPHAATGGQARFVGLEGLRTIGVIAVFITHNGFATGVTFGSLWTIKIGGHTTRPTLLLGHLEIGPAIFFMISAFLLYRPFVTAAFRGSAMPSASAFLRRRCVRVFPAYWLTIIVLVSIHGIEIRGVAHWLKVLSLTQIYTEADFGRIPTLVPTWTLATELTFYGFLIGYAVVLRRCGAHRNAVQRLRLELIAAAALVVFAFVFRVAVYAAAPASPTTQSWAHVGEHWLPGTIDLFALGLGLAAIDAYVRTGNALPNIVAKIAGAPDVCAAFAVGWFLAVPVFTDASAGLGFTTGVDAHLRNLFQMLCAFSLLVPVVFGDQSKGWYRRFVQLRPMAFIGLVSYGIYLWHDYWIVEVVRWSGGRVAFTGHFWLVGITAFAMSFAFGTFSYFRIEAPALRVDASLDARRSSNRDQGRFS